MSAPAQQVRVDLGYRPHPHQREANKLLQAVRFLVLVWHRRAGKTVFAIMALILGALACTKERGRFGYIAPFLGQAKEIAWQYLLAFTAPIPGRVVNVAELSVTFPNGARIRLYGADNPDALRGGYLDGGVLDEVAQMKPEVWGEIIRPMLADRLGWCIFIGTPKGLNLFSQLYFDAVRGLAGWAADMRRASDTGVIPKEELEAARAAMSPQQFAQEFECDFAAAVTNTLVPLDAALAAQRRTVAERDYTYAPKVLGIDVAREGDDRSCFQLRQGLVAFQPRVLRVPDLMELAGQAAEVIEKHKPAAVFVDQGGMGYGLLDRLRQLGHSNVVGVDFGGKPLEPRFANKRTEMWWHMAEWIKGGGCLPANQDLVADLTAPTYSYRNDKGKVELESKRKMKERGLPSPDIGDALALTFAFPVAINSPLERAQERFGPAAHDYDPFAERRA